jgi:hypothetical protein
MGALRVIGFVVGAAAVYATLGSAIRTVILPRAVPARISRVVFVTMRRVFTIRAGPKASYERRDRVMALYAPVSLLSLLATWAVLIVLGYMAMFWGLGDRSPREAFELSGSSMFTLGFRVADDLPTTTLIFTQAAVGLTILAMLITYLPSIYGAFARREAAVTQLEVRAGSPPTGIEMIERYWLLGRIDRISEVWARWESWFVEIEENHTSFPVLVFFRSPQPDHSWVTSAGAVLDAASIIVSTVAVPRDVEAEFCIRAGYLALRRIADFFGIPYDANPKRGDPICIGRDEYEEGCARLEAAGVPLKPDRDETWLDFAGWRVNYDTSLVALAGLTMAPYAPWSSDRSVRWLRPSVFRFRGARFTDRSEPSPP